MLSGYLVCPTQHLYHDNGIIMCQYFPVGCAITIFVTFAFRPVAPGDLKLKNNTVCKWEYPIAGFYPCMKNDT